MTLVDANVLLDVVTDDPRFAPASVAALGMAARAGPLFINDIVYAEISTRYATVDALNDFVTQAGLEMLPMPKEALFLAAKAFLQYRQAGGVRTGVLPDFFIGAQAALMKIKLLTRERGRYATYFPTVELLTP